MPIFNPELDTSSPMGEFFWHATTIEQIFQMIKFDKSGLKPLGTGQLGAGFYVTGTRSDYQKAMARRSRKEIALDVPLFLLYVYVPNFYSLKPYFLDSWSTKENGADFSAVCWFKDGGAGSVGAEEKGGRIPSVRGKGIVNFKYGEYRQEEIADTYLAQEPPKKKQQFFDMLWYYASRNKRPIYEDIKDFERYSVWLIGPNGPKLILKRSLLELAFKSETSLAKSAIVGAKLFSPTDAPLTLRFDYDTKNYDLTETIIWRDTLKYDNNPLNFHDEEWVDLNELLKILGG